MQYLEPRTDVPAKDDWSTVLILRGLRGVRDGGRTESVLTALIAGVTLIGCFFAPATPGNVGAFVLLGLIVLSSAVSPLIHRTQTRAWRLGLLDEPWRRVRAAVAEDQADDEAHRLLLDDGLVLKGWFGDLPDLVRERQEVFVCGPDAEGHAAIRAAGFAEVVNASVEAVETGRYQAKERVERPLIRPMDDPAVVEARAGLRSAARSPFAQAGSAATGAVVILLSLDPLAPTGLVAGVLVLVPALLRLPAAIRARTRSRLLAVAVESSAEWTPVPATLLPWMPGHPVEGHVQLSGGPAIIRFPDPDLHVIANIADTGAMWIAGTHQNVLAVGVPRLRVLSAAEVRPDRDGDRLPLLERLDQRDFSGLPGQEVR